MVKWKRDLILGIVLLAFSIVSIIYSYNLTDVTVQLFLAKADTYVILWMIVLAGLSTALIVRALRERSMEKSAPILTKRVCITAAIILLYVFLMDKLGFVLDSILFVFALLAFFTHEAKGDWPRGKALVKEIAIWAAIALASVLLTQYLFGTLLGTVLPQGIFR